MLTSTPSDANGRRRWFAPAATGVLAAAALVAVYALTMSATAGSLDALARLGAKVDPLVADGEWWRLVVSVYLHADGLHVAMNAAWLALLLVAGVALVGPTRAVATAAAAGYAGQLTSFALTAGPSVGASGAVYGLAATLVVFAWRRRAQIPAERRARLLASLGVAMAALLLFPLAVGAVDHAAHVGGLLAGAALGLLPSRRRVDLALGGTIAAITAAAVLAAVV